MPTVDEPSSRACSLWFIVKPSQAPVSCDKLSQLFGLPLSELEALNPGQLKCSAPVPRSTLLCVAKGDACVAAGALASPIS
jgi:hypothetical protein